MKLNKIALVLMVVLAVVLSSCTTFKLSGVQVTREIQSYDTVGTFDVSVKVYELLGAPGGANLGNVTADAMDTQIYDAIQREIQKYTGDAAVNVVVEYKAEFLDMIIGGFTGSILAPATAHISGTIVKYN
ncbi:MAG: hypothetical protein PF693_20235 [Spirochaetia bacterium]|jgi:hypothetical protein|nr:hypothetical protein [Spirochaetia bacterium]